MSGSHKIADCKPGDQDYILYCHQQIEDAYTLRDAIFWHQRLITELTLEILTAHIFPCKDFQTVVDQLLKTRERHISSLDRLMNASDRNASH